MKLRHSILALVAILTSFSLSSYAQQGDVAETGGNSYTSLQEAIDAATEGATVTLLKDLTLDTETYTINDGKNIILDMNGKTLTVSDNKTELNTNEGNYYLFYIRGSLTVMGNGTIELEATKNRGWEAMSVIFYNRGGVLNIENGEFKHNGGTDMAYVIDNSNNSYGEAVTNIYGGRFSSEYTAIRNSMNKDANGEKAILNIYDGEIEISGKTSAIWSQAASTPCNGEININGGEIGAVNTARDAESTCMTTISGGTVDSFKGKVGELTVKEGGNIKETRILDTASNPVDFFVNEDGIYVEVEHVASIVETKYSSLQEAIDAATEGATIKIESDITLTKGVTVAADDVITLDLNGKTISIKDASGAGAYGIKNNGDLTIKDSEKDGRITFCSTTPDNSYGYATSTIGNGGHLTVENGFIENTTVGGASYAIDGIYHTKDVSLTINDGTIEAKKIAVRQVPFSQTANNVVTINGGTLSGETAGLQLHNTSSDAMKSEVNIAGGTFEGIMYAFYTSYHSISGSAKTTINVDGGTFNGYLYLYNPYEGSDKYPMTVSVTNGTFNMGAYIYTMNSDGTEVYIPDAISGGIFNGIAADNIAKGCKWSYDDRNYIIVYPLLDEEYDETQPQPGIHGKTYKKIALKRTINVKPETGLSNWSTFVVPFGMAKPKEWEVKKLTKSTLIGESITLTFEDADSIEAGVPYMVRTTAPVETIEVTDVMLNTELRHSTTEHVTFVGVYTSGHVPTYSYFISGNTFYRSVNTENPDNIKGYRAYISLNDDKASNARSLSYRFAGQDETEEGTTAMEATTGEATVTAIYTLDGTRISEMQQGVNVLQMSDGNVVKVIIK